MLGRGVHPRIIGIFTAGTPTSRHLRSCTGHWPPTPPEVEKRPWAYPVSRSLASWVRRGPVDTIFLISAVRPRPPHSCPQETRPDSLVQQPRASALARPPA